MRFTALDASGEVLHRDEYFSTGGGFVVRGTAETLAELPALEGVRGVELAPREVPLEQLRVQPLGPEQTTTVGPGSAPRSQPTGG